LIDRLIGSVADSWVRRDIIEADERDVCVYGLDLIVSTCLNISALLLAGLAAGLFAETAAFLCVMLPLQSYAGGYHADTHLRCFLLMLAGWLIVVPNAGFMPQRAAIGASVASCAVICAMAPVPNKNVNMSAAHRARLRRIARVLALAFAALSVLANALGAGRGKHLAAGLMFIACSMAAAWLKNRLSLAGGK
jgi:accessory gene regulator B